jgi:hypothetical protein
VGENQIAGRAWEVEFSREFGLSLVPGSGSTWYSGKLDVEGRGARWSLKWTSKDSYRLTKKDIREAVEATKGIGGTGEVPFWAFNIGGEEMIMTRKEDFKQIQSGELKVIPERRTKTDIRTKLSDVPILLREEE